MILCCIKIEIAGHVLDEKKYDLDDHHNWKYDFGTHSVNFASRSKKDYKIDKYFIEIYEIDDDDFIKQELKRYLGVKK
jgi:hypothetical protein